MLFTRIAHARDRGFSFIELLAYMAIAALLILAAIPQFDAYREQARVSNLQNDAHNAGLAAEGALIDAVSARTHGKAPIKLAAAVPVADTETPARQSAITAAVEQVKTTGGNTLTASFPTDGGFLVTASNVSTPYRAIYASQKTSLTDGDTLHPGVNLVGADDSVGAEPSTPEPEPARDQSEAAMVSTWDTSISGCSTIKLGLGYGGTPKIDWGDGSTPETTPTLGYYKTNFTHAYSGTPGPTTITLDGKFGYFTTDAGTAQCITGVSFWGETGTTMGMSAFYGARNLTAVPALIPSTITNMAGMFSNATKINDPNISKWDVSAVTGMNQMFSSATAFNQPLENWDVSHVTNLSYMFWNASTFNQPLNSWDTRQVTDMGTMFANTNAFDQPLDKWDTSRVQSFNQMFSGAQKFNQDINTWDVSSATNFAGMFEVTGAFNSPLDKWDLRSATTTSGMFYGSSKFNQNIGDWNVSSVEDMSRMFDTAYSFLDQDLSGWDVRSVTNHEGFYDENYLDRIGMPSFPA